MKRIILFVCSFSICLACSSPKTGKNPSTAYTAHDSLIPNNPIIPDRGVNDPHIRIIEGKAYLAASHESPLKTTDS